MTESNKPKSANWRASITDDVLSRAGTSMASRVESYGRDGFSVATERHPGDEPPDSAVQVIARIR